MAKPVSKKKKGKASSEDKYTKAFKRGLLERGEAAVPDASGKLPPGTTHEITGVDSEGLPTVKRDRFSVA